MHISTPSNIILRGSDVNRFAEYFSFLLSHYKIVVLNAPFAEKAI
jgi:hypothetical protein